MKSIGTVEFISNGVNYTTPMYEKTGLEEVSEGTLIMLLMVNGEHYTGYFKGLTDDIWEGNVLLQSESKEHTIGLNVVTVGSFLIHSEAIIK